MKIQTSDAVSRFNAQVELADIALSKCDPDLMFESSANTDQMGPERFL